MQFFLIHNAPLLLMILTKILFIVKLSLKNPPELSSEGLLNLFRYDIYKLVRYTNHLHDFLAVNFCFNFFIR